MGIELMRWRFIGEPPTLDAIARSLAAHENVDVTVARRFPARSGTVFEQLTVHVAGSARVRFKTDEIAWHGNELHILGPPGMHAGYGRILDDVITRLGGALVRD